MSGVATRMARITVGLGAAVITVLMSAAPASAHARVLRTTPGNGATSDGRVKVISVVFDDPVRVVPRSLVVTGATGAPQTIGAPRVVDGHILQAPLSDRLPSGRYFVGWRILSDDGHIESGSFGFSVRATGGAPVSAGDALPPPPAEPAWPVVVAASMAALACAGAALVVVRGLAAVRSVGADPYPPDRRDIGAASDRGHATSRR
jgi:methionine-rich copper-binding protein CopC